MANNKRWLYLFTGAIMLLFQGLIYAWSIFKQPFNAIYEEWTVSQISLTFTISMIFFCLGGFIAGNLSKRMNVRNILWIAAIMLFVGFFGVSGLSTADSKTSLRLLYLLYGVFCGGGVGIGYNAIISSVNKWFADKAGLASGIMMMGFGLGGIILGGIVSSLIGNIGLFTTFKILAILSVIVLVSGSFILKVPDPTGNKTALTIKSDAQKNYSSAEMLKSANFWLFIFWAILLNSAGLLVINSAASIAVAFGASAVLGLIVSVCNGGGRVLMGAIFDRFERKSAMLINIIFVFLAGLSLSVGALKDSIIFIFIGLIFAGVGYGGGPSITSAFIHKEFGPKYYPVNFSLGNFSLIPAAIIGPMISSNLIEREGGKYNTTFYMIMILAGFALIMWMVLNRIIKKKLKI